jgi:hypothetical protein
MFSVWVWRSDQFRVRWEHVESVNCSIAGECVHLVNCRLPVTRHGQTQYMCFANNTIFIVGYFNFSGSIVTVFVIFRWMAHFFDPLPLNR